MTRNEHLNKILELGNSHILKKFEEIITTYKYM